MYSNDKTSKGVNKVLHTFFILFIIVMIGILASTILKRVDGDTLTVTSGEETQEECGDAQAQRAMNQAGIKAPIKCNKKGRN